MKRQLNEDTLQQSQALETMLVGKIHQLVDEAWDKHDEASTQEEKEMYKTAVMELLSKLPENEVHLSTPQ
jgi:galactose-1-phosphate uridylyltransferase